MKVLVQVEFAHGYSGSAHRHQPLAGLGVGLCARRVHLRSVSPSVQRRAAVRPRGASVVAFASTAVADFDPFVQSGSGPITRTGRLASVLPVAPPLARRADAARVSPADRGERPAPDQSAFIGALAPPPRGATARGGADGRDGPARGLQRLQKKALVLTPPHARPWVGARSRRGRAAGSSVTRNTRCVCGCAPCIRR